MVHVDGLNSGGKWKDSAGEKLKKVIEEVGLMNDAGDGFTLKWMTRDKDLHGDLQAKEKIQFVCVETCVEPTTTAEPTTTTMEPTTTTMEPTTTTMEPTTTTMEPTTTTMEPTTTTMEPTTTTMEPTTTTAEPTTTEEPTTSTTTEELPCPLNELDGVDGWVHAGGVCFQ